MKVHQAVQVCIFNLLWVCFGGISSAQAQLNAGSQVVAYGLSGFKNAVSSAMGNTSLSALYNQLSFVNNIAQLPLSNKTAGIGLSYTPTLPGVPIQNAKWFQMILEGYYVFGENYYQPSTQKLAAIYECYNVGSSRLRDIRGRVLSVGKNGYVLRRQALSFKASYYSRGTIIGKDENNVSLGEANPFDLSVALGYSVNLWDNFSVGLALRYLNSTIYGSSSTGPLSNYSLQSLSSSSFSGDLYLLYDVPFKQHDRGGMTFGMILGNVGTKINFDNGATGYQPAYLDVGMSLTSIYDEDHSFHYTADFKKSLVHELPAPGLITYENLKRYSSLSVMQSMVNSFETLGTFTASVGGKYIYKEMFSVAGGFEWGRDSYGNRYRASVGLGYSYKNKLNFEAAYWLPFGSTALMLRYASSFSLSASVEF